MLKSLMKAVGISEPAKTEAATESLAITLDTTAIQAAIDAAVGELRAEFDGYKETAESMVAAAEEASALLATQLADASAALETAQAALTAAVAEKEALLATAATKAVATRLEKIVAAVGEAKAPALLAATESLDDAAFEAVVSALVGGVKAEANTALFKEVGVTAEVDASKVVVESKEMTILKKKYAK